MADFSDKMKKAWLKSMEAIGNTAGNIANNTRYKVNEMTLLNRRREILSDFGARAYDLWQKGEVFPEELAKQLEELSQVDIQLNALRMERLAGVSAQDEQEGPAEEEGTEKIPKSDAAGEAPAQETSATPEATSPLADKANQALDTIGSTLKSVGSFLGGAINSVADTLAGKKGAVSEKNPQEEDDNADLSREPTCPEDVAEAPEEPDVMPAQDDSQPKSEDAEQEDASKPTGENPDEYKIE